MSLENSGKHTMLDGPWGGQDGFYWDDGVYSTVRQLEIAHGTGIDSIKIEYDMKGKSVWSQKHGGSGGSKVDKVRLEYPDEYLTSMHGHYGSLHERGLSIIRSLTFQTNKRTYGPFGVQQGTYFTSKLHGKIVGFVGKSGWYLDAIGVYVEPLLLHKPNKNVTNSVDPLLHKPIVTNSIYHSYQNVAHGTHEKYEYSMIQGSLGKNYDLIVAVRQKDNNIDTNTSPINLFGQISHTGPKNEIASVVPSKIESVPFNNVKGVVKSGTWGGSGGSVFDDGVYDGISQINVSRNVAIVSIRVCYDKNGEPVWGSKNGGTGSIKSDKIVFDYPSEKLTHITGYHGPTMIMGPNVIKSLTFHTTKGKHGPYGEEEGEFFSTKSKEGSLILGFHGKKGLFVDAIGVHMIEGNHVHVPDLSSHNKDAVISSISDTKQGVSISPSKPYNQTAPHTKPHNQTAPHSNPHNQTAPHSKPHNQTAPHSNPYNQTAPHSKPHNQTAPPTSKVDNSEWTYKMVNRGQPEEVVQRLVKNPAPYGTGPWGGEGGKPWDDGVFTGIKQIILTKTDAICCIEIEYDRNGQSVWSVKHGGTGGQTANRVKLEYPNEVLTCISGYYGPIKKDHGTRVIQSLTFHTSRRKYGPFGEEIGTYFTSGTTEGKVVGFHGRSSVYLDAIGVHMQHWLGNQKPSKHGSLMKMFS